MSGITKRDYEWLEAATGALAKRNQLPVEQRIEFLNEIAAKLGIGETKPVNTDPFYVASLQLRVMVLEALLEMQHGPVEASKGWGSTPKPTVTFAFKK